MYLERNIDKELRNWKKETERKPLLVRGARQVGKSSSIRKLGESFDSYLEVNFEEHKRVHSLFEGDLTPQLLCENLSVMFDMEIVSGKTLLFFDEIQSCIPAILSLRFFYEKIPGLHVVAAGSSVEVFGWTEPGTNIVVNRQTLPVNQQGLFLGKVRISQDKPDIRVQASNDKSTKEIIRKFRVN